MVPARVLVFPPGGRAPRRVRAHSACGGAGDRGARGEAGDEERLSPAAEWKLFCAGGGDEEQTAEDAEGAGEQTVEIGSEKMKN